MTNPIIGTNAYDKWLKEYRETTNVYAGAGTMESWYECYMVKNRTPEQQEKAQKKFIREETRAGNDNVTRMIVKHKKLYYEEMKERNLLKALKAWKAFDEICDINDDIKQEISKYLV